MSATQTNPSALSGAISRTAYLAVCAVMNLREAMALRNTRRTLMALSDAQLADIGLTRGDIHTRTSAF